MVFWLVVLALAAVVVSFSSDFFALLRWPALILFIAWLTSYVLEPPIAWLQVHLPPHSRGLSAAIVYVVMILVAFFVVCAAAVAIFNAAVAFVDRLPAILARVRELLQPILDGADIHLPGGGNPADRITDFIQGYGQQLGDALVTVVANVVALIGALFTAVVISVGLAAGQVTLLGWLRPFLPTSTYSDLTQLEQAIAVSFGGFVRGRLLIGLIFGGIVWVAAFVLGIPLGALIGIIAGLIIFIPWIGPLIAWAVLPAFALVLAPDVVGPALAVSLIAAILVQVIITQLVMGAAVKLKPVAVFAVVIVGSALAGIAGAVFAIPTAAAILAVADYLRERDLLLRAGPPETSPATAQSGETEAGATGGTTPGAGAAGGTTPEAEPTGA